MTRRSINSPVSRPDVAEHFDHYFSLEGERRDQFIDRLHKDIDALQTFPETSIGYEDDRQDYKDVRSELLRFGNYVYWTSCLLDNLSSEAREALYDAGFSKEDLECLFEIIDQNIHCADDAAENLPGTKGKRPVKRRKFACALTCMMYFQELKPEHAKKEDGQLIDFAERTLELAAGNRDIAMRNSINKAFDLGY